MLLPESRHVADVSALPLDVQELVGSHEVYKLEVDLL